MGVRFREDNEDALGVDFEALRTLPAMPAYVSLARDGREVGGSSSSWTECVWPARTRSYAKRGVSGCGARKTVFTSSGRKPKRPTCVRRTPRLNSWGRVHDRRWSPRAEIPEPTLFMGPQWARALASRLGRVEGAACPWRGGRSASRSIAVRNTHGEVQFSRRVGSTPLGRSHHARVQVLPVPDRATASNHRRCGPLHCAGQT
jgi:hypothetical protein